MIHHHLTGERQNRINSLRPYFERISRGVCLLCKDRGPSGIEYIQDSNLTICDVCHSKIRDSSQWSSGYTEYITSLSQTCIKTIDITKITTGEKILGSVIIPEDETENIELDIPQYLCETSTSGIYFHVFDNRFIVLDLAEGFLVVELNSNVGWCIPNSINREIVPEVFDKAEDVTLLYPKKEFAKEITPSQLMANKI